jgi:hypothetical protein
MKRQQASLGLREISTNFVTSTRASSSDFRSRGCACWACKWILTSSRASFGQRKVRRLLPAYSSSIKQTPWIQDSEGCSYLYMAAKGESISFEKESFVGFTNSDGSRPSEGRIRGQTIQLWSQSRPSVLKQSREGLIVSREEELNDLISAFGRRVHEEHRNVERVGCPGRPALTTLAEAAAPLCSDSILEHVRNCAACLDELKELRKPKYE